MQGQPLERAEVGRAPALNWTVLARQYAVLSAEYGALQASCREEHQILQHISQSRCWRLLCFSRRAVRVLLCNARRVMLARAGMRMLRRFLGWPGLRYSEAPDRVQPGLRSTSAPATPGCADTLPLPHGQTIASLDRSLRIAYIGDRGPYEASSMRYRANNLIEALAMHGTPATFVPEEDLPAHLEAVMAHDVMVLVRRRWNPKIKALVQAARQAGIPLVFDLDDFLLDPWILPYIDSARGSLSQWTLQFIKDLRATLESCDYFTATTRFLVEQVALWNKPGWVIRNGLNETQLERCRALLEQPRPTTADGLVHIGYFSGTKTHQADFRAAYAALVRVLHDFEQARLVLVGELDLQEFPGLEPFAGQIEQRPRVDWRDLPALMAKADMNIVPLEINPYTQAKSELKYFEAGILKVPTIASATEVFANSIRPGVTGLLAASDEEWYQALKLLVSDAVLRRRLGESAHAHVLRDYVPAAVAADALSAYEQILHAHRNRCDVAA